MFVKCLNWSSMAVTIEFEDRILCWISTPFCTVVFYAWKHKNLGTDFVSNSIDLGLGCFYLLSETWMKPSVLALNADMNTEPKKKVKLREDWREKSRPIPPGGTYPAKDHCRFSLLFFISQFLSGSYLSSWCCNGIAVGVGYATLITLPMWRMHVHF